MSARGAARAFRGCRTIQPGDGSIADIPQTRLRRLATHWRGLHRDGERPTRADVDPTTIPDLLPFLAIVEVHDDARRFHFRLVGTDIAFGTDPTGTDLNDSSPEGPYREHILSLYRLGALSPSGLYSSFDYGYGDIVGPRSIHRLFMPIAGNAAAPEMMLVGQTREHNILVTRSAWQAGPDRIQQQKLFTLTADLTEHL